MNFFINRENEFLWCNSTYEFLHKNLNPSIQVLNLSTDHIERNSANLIASVMEDPSSNLMELILDQCRLSETSTIIIINALPASKIKNLSLNRNVITNIVCDAIAEALSKNPQLEYLSLSACDISADGCCTIAKSLPFAKQLQTFIINSNCIFDKGCEEIAQNIRNTNISEISVSDNQIWLSGTSMLLKSLTAFPNITGLDLSFNIVDLALLAQFIKETPSLKNLSISGCKVNESQVHLFLEELGKTQLSTFIIEGLNFNQLPISWPHSQDVLWSKASNFDVLLQSIRNSHNLIDLRFGFLDIKQISSFYSLYQTNVITRPITVSLSDFGRTGNNWVISFPNFSVDAPLPIFKWASRIISDDAPFFSTLFKSSTFQGKPLETLDISNTSITDDTLQKILAGFNDVHLFLFDLSKNAIRDPSVETITPFFEHSTVEQLILNDTSITEFGLQRFFRYFVKNNPSVIPKVLKFSFSTPDSTENGDDKGTENDSESELHFHDFFNELAELVSINAPIVELEITGNVTAKDMTPIFKNLSKNNHIRKIVIPQILEKYKTLDYTIEDQTQESYNEMVNALFHSLTDKDSNCVLQQLTYPILTTIFLFNDDILAVWGEVESKLAENKRKNENDDFPKDDN